MNQIKNIKKGVVILITVAIFRVFFLKENNVTTGDGMENNNNEWSKILHPQTMRNDDCGQGSYLSSRGSRQHKGVDLICYEYQSVFAPFDGIITRSFNAYQNDSNYKGVEISDNNGIKVKIMYVSPDYGLIGQYVVKGQEIATCQSISDKYNCSMLDHLHIEVFENGININPTSLLRV